MPTRQQASPHDCKRRNVLATAVLHISVGSEDANMLQLHTPEKGNNKSDLSLAISPPAEMDVHVLFPGGFGVLGIQVRV